MRRNLAGAICAAIGFAAGDGFLIPSGAPHSGRIGSDGLRSLGTFIVEKDRPLLSLAPE
jgi:hypothetical protein